MTEVETETREVPSAAGLEVSGETFYPIVKDGALVVFATFFALVVFAVSSFGLDGERAAGSPGEPVRSFPGIIDVTLDEFVIEGDLTAPAGDVTLLITNVGSVEHNVVARNLGRRTFDLRTGDETTLTLGSLAPGEYELFCDIIGHEESGMVATLTVTEP